MAKGTIDMLPELAALAEAYLPRSVTIISRETYGGAIRMEIQGSRIEEGASYQIVVTDEPTRRCIELKQTPDA